MAVLVKESIHAVLVCASVAHRNSVKTVLDRFSSRPRNGVSRIADYQEENTNKYGNGPTLISLMEFASRADADEAWTDAMAVWPGNFRDGSFAMQYTSREGDGENSTEFHGAVSLP